MFKHMIALDADAFRAGLATGGLIKLGYKLIEDGTRVQERIRLIAYGPTSNFQLYETSLDGLSVGNKGFKIKDNVELFLALAAMRKDKTKFYPGEMVIRIGDNIGQVKKGNFYTIKTVADSFLKLEELGNIGYSPTSFRKATEKEIFAHFENKPELVELSIQEKFILQLNF